MIVPVVYTYCVIRQRYTVIKKSDL